MNQPSKAELKPVRIDSLMTYPVKGLRGVAHEEATLTENGLEGDRMFMLASATIIGGVAARLTLREHPELAQITTDYTDNGILLTRPEGDSVLLPYDIDEGEPIEAKLWHGPDKGSIDGLRISNEADDWISDFVGKKAHILAVPDTHRRTMAESGQQPQAASFTGRATDGYPLHVVSLASLRYLNETRVKKGLPHISIEHFRANIVLDGDDLEPFAEDTWTSIKLERERKVTRIMSVRACERCVSIESTPFTGEKRRDVLKSLGELKAERVISDKLIFGTWAAPSITSVEDVIEKDQLGTPEIT